VQQPADFFGCEVEYAGMLGKALAMELHMLQGLLQQPRDVRYRKKSDRRRAAAQAMRQPDRRIAHGLVQFKGPLAQLGQQTTRPFVGLVQIDVVQRNTDPQVSNHLDRFIHRRRKVRIGAKAGSIDPLSGQCV